MKDQLVFKLQGGMKTYRSHLGRRKNSRPVVLTTSSGVNVTNFSHTSGHRKITNERRNDTPDDGCGTTRGQSNRKGGSHGSP